MPWLLPICARLPMRCWQHSRRAKKKLSRCVLVWEQLVRNTRSRKWASILLSPANAFGKSKRKRCASCVILRVRASSKRSWKIRSDNFVAQNEDAEDHYLRRFFDIAKSLRSYLKVRKAVLFAV